MSQSRAVHLGADHGLEINVRRPCGVRAIAFELGRLDRFHDAACTIAARMTANKWPPSGDKLSLSQSRNSSLMLVLERVRSSTRLTITAQASAGPPSLPGSAPGTTTEYSGTRP